MIVVDFMHIEPESTTIMEMRCGWDAIIAQTPHKSGQNGLASR